MHHLAQVRSASLLRGFFELPTFTDTSALTSAEANLASSICIDLPEISMLPFLTALAAWKFSQIPSLYLQKYQSHGGISPGAIFIGLTTCEIWSTKRDE